MLRPGGDVGIVSTGLMTERALDAAAMLAADGIDAGVLHVPTLKPFDAEAVAAFARVSRPRGDRREPRHRVGSAPWSPRPCSRPGDRMPLPRVGLPDAFIELGAAPTLMARNGMTAEGIVAAARTRG